MNLFPLTASFLLGVVLTLAALAWRKRNLPSESLEEAEPVPEGEPFDPVSAAQNLLTEEEELRALYERLGFSLDLERRAQALMEEIKASILVEIPSFAAFKESVDAILPTLEAPRKDDALAEARRSRACDPLLKAVLAASDEGGVLEALGRAPVDEVLPFVEEVPLLRGGAVVWRTPMGLDVLHKRAKDPERLGRRLEELVERIRASALRREPQAKTELLKAAAALHEAVAEGQTYLVTPIKTLERKLAQWYLAPEDSAARERRRRLDELLLELLTVRQQAFSSPAAGAEEASPELLRDRLTALVQGYVSSPALHTPRLSQLLLEPFLAVEASRVAHRPPSEASNLLLRCVAKEVRSGRFDRDESVRRLRSLEPAGLFVHSLVYRLLEMATP